MERIIPLREIIGNYNLVGCSRTGYRIIPLREIIGNYNTKYVAVGDALNYTLERDNRELQRALSFLVELHHYTLERDNRELQLVAEHTLYYPYYTLERDNRELQLISKSLSREQAIIPLREIIGNYNHRQV